MDSSKLNSFISSRTTFQKVFDSSWCCCFCFFDSCLFLWKKVLRKAFRLLGLGHGIPLNVEYLLKRVIGSSVGFVAAGYWQRIWQDTKSQNIICTRSHHFVECAWVTGGSLSSRKSRRRSIHLLIMLLMMKLEWRVVGLRSHKWLISVCLVVLLSSVRWNLLVFFRIAIFLKIGPSPKSTW